MSRLAELGSDWLVCVRLDCSSEEPIASAEADFPAVTAGVSSAATAAAAAATRLR